MNTLPISGKGATAADLPIGLEEARAYFQDLPAFFAKIDAVDQVRPLARPGAYLISHHPVGGLDYKVVMVCVQQAEWHAGGMTLRSLDFDTEKHVASYPVVKGFIEGELKLAARDAHTTAVDFSFSCAIDLPLVSVLKFLPRAVVQATADGIMGYQVKLTVQNLFRKVLEDFRLGVPLQRVEEAS